ncbi:MAG: DUF3857 domain-containing protein [Bacteroidota bacterium]
MIKRVLFLSTIFIGLSLMADAQQKAKQQIKWGKFPVEELEMMEYEKDLTAPGLVLYDRGVIDVKLLVEGIRYRFRRHRRVKIFDPDAFAHGEFGIPYCSEMNAEKVTAVKALIISPDGKKRNLSKKDFMERNLSGGWSLREMSLPELEKGSIIEYRFEIQSDRIGHLRDWYFQENIPIRYSELRLELPEWVEYITLIHGDLEPLKESEDQNFVLETSLDDVLEHDPQVKIETSRFVMKDVPALKEVPDVTNMNDYRAKIRFQLSKIHYPNNKTEPILNSWDFLAEELLQSPKFGQQFLEKANFEAISKAAQALNLAGKDEEHTTSALYEFLNNKVLWNGEYALMADTSLDVRFAEGRASGSELNMMLLALLRQQNITAHPLLVSTRKHGKMIQQYPILEQFNHMLVYVEREGRPLMLDLSDPLRPLDYIREEALNSYGWLIRKDDAEWIAIDPLAGSEVFVAQMEMDAEGHVSGTLKGTFSGYDAIHERRQYTGDRRGDYWQERLAAMTPMAEASVQSIEHLDDLSRPFEANIEVNLRSAAARQSDQLSFAPVFYTRYAQPRYTAKTRDYPVDFVYPFKEQFVVDLKIPEGYKVVELPESKRVITRHGGAVFNYIIKDTGDRVQLISKIQVKQLKFDSEEYDDIKEFFDHIAAKFKEQVVLQKK